MPFLPLPADLSLGRTTVVLLAVAGIASYDLARRIRHRPTHLLFACVLGTVLSAGLMSAADAFLATPAQSGPHVLALMLLLVLLAWRTLFGPWETSTKATVLGTFLFWIAFRELLQGEPAERLIRLAAVGVALVPAGIWCTLFLKYHRERLSAILLMFFAGMLSTVPILFYDALVRRGVELNFFLVRVHPESFHRALQTLVGSHGAAGNVRSALLASLLSFLVVALIEEVSKYWVLRRSGQRIFSSIDDVLQLAIVVAIGFSFAENIINPVYFTGFVREYLLDPSTRNIFEFFTNVLGRSVLTTMVHIVSTGVMGYFLGKAIFADPLLTEERAQGRRMRLLRAIHRLLRLPEESIFRTEMILVGVTCAVLLHGAFNFTVTLPDLLPSHPHTLGELFQLPPTAFLQRIPLLLMPSLFYVVGGFWLLTELALRKQNSKERGHVIETRIFIQEAGTEA